MWRKKENIIFGIGIGILILVAVVVGNITKKSFIDDISDKALEKYSSDLNFRISKSLRENEDVENIKKLEEIEEYAELILKVRITENREYKAQSMLTECEVLKVYQNKGNIGVEKEIYVYDPSWYSVPYEGYFGMEGYNLLKPKDEYILFVNRVGESKEGKNYKVEEDRYVLTNSKVSRFNLNKNSNVTYIEEEKINNGISFNKLKDYERVFDNKKKMEEYLLLKSEVIKKYEGNDGK